MRHRHRRRRTDARMTCWAGCNGNGKDDGWLNDLTVKCTNDATGAATGCQILKNFDVSLCQREERSRGRCSIADADTNTAICTWTEGNNQPQQDGTWIAAVDISSSGEQGEGAQSRVLWKKQLDGEKRVEGVRTYSVRANSSRNMSENPDGTISRSTQLFINTSDLRGNNTNDRKGGRYLQQNVGVVEATKDGLKWIGQPHRRHHADAGHRRHPPHRRPGAGAGRHQDGSGAHLLPGQPERRRLQPARPQGAGRRFHDAEVHRLRHALGRRLLRSPPVLELSRRQSRQPGTQLCRRAVHPQPVLRRERQQRQVSAHARHHRQGPRRRGQAGGQAETRSSASCR